MINLRRTAVWVGSILLAAAFVAIGVSKLTGPSALRWTERFGHWGYPPSVQYVVGVLEVLAGVGLLIPRWRRAATMILGVVMIGAVGTHVVNGELPRVVPPLVLGGLAFLIYWSDRRLSH